MAKEVIPSDTAIQEHLKGVLAAVDIINNGNVGEMTDQPDQA